MSPLSRELVFVLLQFLDEEKYKETRHKLEKESGFFFNMKYFEDAVINGEWEEAENYLSGFTKFDDNCYSKRIFFEIRKKKYLEALDKQDRAKAGNILTDELKALKLDEDVLNELTELMTLSNIRRDGKLSSDGDVKSTRAIMLVELKKCIVENPLFRDKLQFPTLKESRLTTLINQSLNFQHQLCENPKPKPDIETLFADHVCGHPSGPHLQDGWPAILSATPRCFSGTYGLNSPNELENYYQVNNPPINMLPLYPSDNSLYTADDLPKKVVAILNVGSAVKSMDFHPVQQTQLLVGTVIGEISIWEVSNRERIAVRKFEVWDLGSCWMRFQEHLAIEYAASVNRIKWSPDGSLFGVAYSKHIIHLYGYNGSGDLRNHLEIDAHVGKVNDLAFSHWKDQLCVITCGQDRTVKVWLAATGVMQFMFEGHDISIYSVCPSQKGNTQFILSTDVFGKIKTWLYDDFGWLEEHNAPGASCTIIAYSADETRLFSCTSRYLPSHLVEWHESGSLKWNEHFGTVKRKYVGLASDSIEVVHFDTTKNRFLAVGDESKIKFWDMDNENVMISIDADGGLPVSPCIRFSKDGALLSVEAIDNGIKILANAQGVRLIENRLAILRDLAMCS